MLRMCIDAPVLFANSIKNGIEHREVSEKSVGYNMFFIFGVSIKFVK